MALVGGVNSTSRRVAPGSDFSGPVAKRLVSLVVLLSFPSRFLVILTSVMVF